MTQIALPLDAPSHPVGPVVRYCRPSDSLATLAEVIGEAKGGDRLAPVTVIVSSNVAGVMARRALGRRGGVLGVDVVTLGRVAELIAGPSLAHEGRQPVSDPILEVTIDGVLRRSPGMFASVASHPTTVTALRAAHQELRLAGPDGATRLAARGRRGAEIVRVSRAITTALAGAWYDEADIVARASELVADDAPAGLRHLVFHLPQTSDVLSTEFARRLATLVPTTLVTALTGVPAADAPALAAVRSFRGGEAIGRAPQVDDRAPATPATIITTTDADDEVRVALRHVVDAARGELTGTPVPFERIGIFWPSRVPYARLVEHHLDADGVPWNGRGGIAVTERLAPRLLLDLLDVDRRRFRRSDLFDLLADVPVRDAEGRRRPTAEWHRVARATGVSEDRDWGRLRGVGEMSRWSRPATELADFVDDLRDRLGHPDATRSWKEWTSWSDEQLTHWLGPRAEIRLSDAEYRAWEALMRTLDRLRSLDRVAEPVSRRRFRAVLESELDSIAVREGRIGTGVVTGSLASAPGLDLDVAIVVGAADGAMPPPPRADPLLSDADRVAAGMPSADQHADRMLAAFRGLIEACTTVVIAPRGDLRNTTELQLTRWLDPAIVGSTPRVHVDSAAAGLRLLPDPPCEREFRLTSQLRAGRPDPGGDLVLARALAMRAGRAADHFTEYDGDLTSTEVPTLGGRPVSPTQIQQWASCPHAYFARYLLGVRPIEEVDRDISIRALDSGTLQHEVLDRLHHDVLAGRLPQPNAGWSPEHRAAVLTHFDDVCAELERRGRTGRPATWFGARARLRSELLSWLDHDSAVTAAHGAEIVRSEFSFGQIPLDESGELRPDLWEPVTVALPDGRRLAMHGSADRIDRWRDGTIVVTDHKTGRDHYTKLSADDPTLDGTVFQLPAYAAAAQILAATTGPAIVRAEYSMFEKGNYARRGLSFTDEVWERVAEALGDVVEGIEAGWFPHVPDAPGFRLWIGCEHCDPDGIGTEPNWERWTAKRNDPRSSRWFAEPRDDSADDPDDPDDPDEEHGR